jgi:hypothetical protein
MADSKQQLTREFKGRRVRLEKYSLWIRMLRALGLASFVTEAKTCLAKSALLA